MVDTSVDIAIVTCKQFADLTSDDRKLFQAVHDKQCKVSIVLWDDKTVDWSTFKLCILRTPWDYTTRYVEFTSWLEKVNSQVTLLNDPKILLWNSHKKYLIELEQQGIPIVPSVLISKHSTESDIEQILKKRGWEMSIIKPSIGSFGNDVLLMRFSELNKKSKHLRILLQEQDLLVQPFFSSVKTRGEISLIFLNGEYSHSIKKIPSNGDYKVQGGKVESYEPSNEEIQLSLRTLQASSTCIYGGNKSLNVFLYARVDLLFSNTGTERFVSEVEVLGKNKKGSKLVILNIDPELFFRYSPQAAEKLANVIVNKLKLLYILSIETFVIVILLLQTLYKV